MSGYTARPTSSERKAPWLSKVLAFRSLISKRSQNLSANQKFIRPAFPKSLTSAHPAVTSPPAPTTAGRTQTPPSRVPPIPRSHPQKHHAICRHPQITHPSIPKPPFTFSLHQPTQPSETTFTQEAVTCPIFPPLQSHRPRPEPTLIQITLHPNESRPI